MLLSVGSALVSANIKTDTLAGYLNATKLCVINDAKAVLAGRAYSLLHETSLKIADFS